MAERVRGRKLQQIRARHLWGNPLCVMCAARGITTAATQLDHIIALCNGGTNEDRNYQGLCAMHHKQKTAVDMGYKTRPTIGLDGYPVEDKK